MPVGSASAPDFILIWWTRGAPVRPVHDSSPAGGGVIDDRLGWCLGLSGRSGMGIIPVETEGAPDPFDASPGCLGGSGPGAADGGAKESLVGPHEVDPVLGVDVEALEDGSEMLGDEAALVAADDSAGGVDQIEIFVETEGGGGDLRVVDGDVTALEGGDPEFALRAKFEHAPEFGADGAGVLLVEEDGLSPLLTAADPLPDAGVAAVLGAVDDGGADGVEVDVDQAGDQRSLVE